MRVGAEFNTSAINLLKDSGPAVLICASPRTGIPYTLDEDAYEELSGNSDAETREMEDWLAFFAERYGVFFSSPLDLDFSMLESFPTSTKHSPQLPVDRDCRIEALPDISEAVKQRMRQVLAADASTAPGTLGSTYTGYRKRAFRMVQVLVC